MIEVKLQFATIAAAVAALALISGTHESAAAQVSSTGVSADEKAAVTGAAAAVNKVKTTHKAETPVTPAVDYPTLQKAVFKLAGIVKGANLDAQEHVVAIAKTFGFEGFKAMSEAGPEGAKHFAAALAKVNAKIEELAELAAA